MKFGTIIKRNISIEGETIEMKIERITTHNEPITDGAPLIYTDRKDGVLPAYDPRTDKWDIAIEAMNKVAESRLLRRAEFQKQKEQPPVIPGEIPEG